jgi:hypothetical protein
VTCAVKGMRGAEGELAREGAGHGYAARMGVPAHSAYVRLGS